MFADAFQKYEFPKFGYVRLPDIQITEEERNQAGAVPGLSNVEFLKVLARKGFKKKVPKDKTQEYGARVNKELELLEELGFIDYVLLVWKVTSFCDRTKIARDYGRGSACGSLVFYLIGATKVDPIKYDLYFERFVSRARAKSKMIDGVLYIDGGLAPDVDIDVEQTKRQKVVEYLQSLYPGRVCKISTFSTLQGKLLIKECGKIVSEKSEDEMKAIAAKIEKRFGIVQDIEEAYKGKWDKEKDKWDIPPSEDFKKWCDENPEVYEIALKLRDVIKNRGSHPSGFVVAYDPISEFLPVGLTSKVKDENSDETSDEKEVAATFSMDQVANLTIKLDLLGVRCCSVVAEVLQLAGISDEDVNVDCDPIIYDNLQNLERPHGIFQIEAPTNLRVCQKVKPKKLLELSDVLAIARPGALSFLGDYENNDVVKIHRLIDPILAATRGVCLYQEQVMAMFHAIGFTLEDAELIRRVIGKKKIEEVNAWKSKIYDMCEKNGIPIPVADLIWKICDDSAKYQFNKSHSVGYGCESALTAYLKFKYPLFFFLALLKQVNDEPKPLEELAKIHAEMPLFGIKLLPPDILKSKMDFAIEGQDIRFGLSSIKNISDKALAKVVAFQKEYANKFEVFQSSIDSGMNIRILASLIQSGCLDSLDTKNSRPRLTLEAQLWKILSDKERVIAMKLGPEFNYDLLGLVNQLVPRNLIKESRWVTIKRKYEPAKEVYQINAKMRKLANYFYERTLLGYVHSCRLVDIFKSDNNALTDVYSVKAAEKNDHVYFMAVVSEKPFEGASKKTGGKYIRYTLEDERDSITALFFDGGFNRGKKVTGKIENMKKENKGDIPRINSMVLCRGRKMDDCVFLDEIYDQNYRIYTKFADIEKFNKEMGAEPQTTFL